ncbi:translation initiation factor IF-5A [Candidatus Pacearchaeota archaeon CG_4_9_14_3_um_filter_31_7]|nr:MAG: translation initiation factor IF-5A [Candidatus Pacearchaeota archaeon CG1_02_31_27]PIN92325.1 MAG: translation initiation factor IF-5A [Candidatus Pacearchaeota archaeon CG10_big_fil_rev_8_21_14_0_10_31_59]PIZ79993.1 MAG: translation initiation factor IF-5A [Candidatus Pacearchaeota archaeon CG_4_10_14_0_2_um_filter_31_10]PJA70566.1 MAG: translation initiation factor IF-5A [Candidatus Pacearchaeota archaeon CG_4_9_14_3_um_filter_31_7]
MVYKWVEVTELKTGSYAIIDEAPCIIKKIDISKTGKHGHAKARIEAVGLIDDKKRIVVKTGHDKLGVPAIEKRRGQVLNFNNNAANLMDIENYETIEVEVPEELKSSLSEGSQVEYWNVEGVNIIKRSV